MRYSSMHKKYLQWLILISKMRTGYAKPGIGVDPDYYYTHTHTHKKQCFDD